MIETTVPNVICTIDQQANFVSLIDLQDAAQGGFLIRSCHRRRHKTAFDIKEVCITSDLAAAIQDSDQLLRIVFTENNKPISTLSSFSASDKGY